MISSLQDLVLKDFWLKLFSFALATLIWFTIKIAIKNDISPVASLSLAATEQLTLHELPIDVLSAPQPARRYIITPGTVEVTVQGEPANLKNLHREDVRVLVDLSDTAAAQSSRRQVEVSTPPGITHVKVEPEEVQITAEVRN